VGNQPGGIEESAVAADGNHQVGLVSDLIFRDSGSQVCRCIQWIVRGQQCADPAFPEMRKEHQRGFGDARVAESAYERASLRR
jgi:hypothetical protein